MADSGIELDEATVEAVNTSFTSSKPMLVAYVDPDGQAHISFRGSTHVHGPDQLAIWVRDPDGGLLGAVDKNPRITLMYRDPESRTQFMFFGRGHVATGAESDRVYDESPEGERNRDPEKKGKAVVIDLDLVQGGAPGNRIELRRG